MVRDHRGPTEALGGPRAGSAWPSSCPWSARGCRELGSQPHAFPWSWSQDSTGRPGETCVVWAVRHTPHLAAPSLQVATWTWRARRRGRRWRPMA